MAHVIPFHGTLYNPPTVGDVRQVVAPPYDIIDSALQKTLHDRHPNNVIRLELGYEQPGDNTGEQQIYPRRGRAEGLAEIRRITPGLPARYLLSHDRISTALFGSRHSDEAI